MFELLLAGQLFRRRVLRRAKQLLFEIFQRGVSPVEAEPGKSREIGHRISRVGRFRHGVAQRTGQRANCVISNRLPRFRIKACSALVLLQMELVGDFSRGGAGRKIRLLFVNSLAKSSFVSRAPCAIEISWLATGW